MSKTYRKSIFIFIFAILIMKNEVSMTMNG